MARENYKNLMRDLTKIMGNGELDSNQLAHMCKAVSKKNLIVYVRGRNTSLIKINHILS
jgi:hypothetical protein